MWSRSASTASSATIPASSEARLAAVKRRALAGIFALALAVAGLLAATVTAGLRPLSALATTTSTTPATTAAEPLIATGVSVGGVGKGCGGRPGEPQLYLRDLRPWIAKAVVGRALYRRRAEAAIAGALLANKHGPLRLHQKTIRPKVTRASFGPVIVIRRGSNRLHLYRGIKPLRVFPV